jgi:predicted O-methyltransferase YrrM
VTGGRLTTFDIDEARLARAKQNFARAKVSSMITTVLGDAHQTVKQLTAPIDLLFLDADKNGYVDYLRQLSRLVKKSGLIVAHNMRFPPPDPRYLDAVTRAPELETIFLNMDGAGIGVTLKKGP